MTGSGLVGVTELEQLPDEVPLLLRFSNMALSARILGVMLRIFLPESALPPTRAGDPLVPVGDMLGGVTDMLASAVVLSNGLWSSLTSWPGMVAKLRVDSMAVDEPGIQDAREEESKTDTIRLVAVVKAEWWCLDMLDWVTVLAVEARLGVGLEPLKALASDATMVFIQLLSPF
jgi:hypothetical protein